MNVIQNHKILRIKYNSFQRFHRILTYWIQAQYFGELDEEWGFEVRYEDALCRLTYKDYEEMLNIFLDENDFKDMLEKLKEYTNEEIKVYNSNTGSLMFVL